MLLEKIESVLNTQIALESYASQNYLAMASWCDGESMEGCAEFLYRQSEEEREHMMKLIHYVNESDGRAVIPAVGQPPIEYPSIQELFQLVYDHEKKVTAAINNIVALCYEEKDHATLNFIQWYVEEQREEEALMRTILDRIQLIGSGPQSLYFIDKELREINKAAAAAEAAEAE
ncbi:MAG: ferritin [Bacteroidota bacterium]